MSAATLQTSSANCNTGSVLTDEPRWSSAALCVDLHLLTTSQSFKPEYTHQCVEGEVFRGHQPFATALEAASKRFKERSSSNGKADQDALLHKSHRGHTTSSNELAIKVELAPSCRKCKVNVQTKSKNCESTEEPCAKKAKLDYESNNESLSSSPPSNTENREVINNTPMTAAEIQESVSKALPEIVDNPCTNDYLENPVGTILEEYTATTKEGCSNDYCLSFADGLGANEYHTQVQKLALWFIENADDVDVSNQDSGFWKVLYLFQKHPSKGYSLVGYMTLFHFMAPFYKPNPGIIVRICQALVFPPYQGQGHGKRMMQIVYDILHGKFQQKAYGNAVRIPLVQINIEDPAPGFVALRNKMDLELMAEHAQWWSQQDEGTNHHLVVTDEGFFVALSEADALAASGLAKITPRQVHIVRELLKLLALKAYTGDAKEALTTKFRLMMKKRLNKEHAEEISTYSTKERKKAYLAELYDMEMQLYESLLTRRS
jgi:histone acetyltransferase 1